MQLPAGLLSPNIVATSAGVGLQNDTIGPAVAGSRLRLWAWSVQLDEGATQRVRGYLTTPAGAAAAVDLFALSQQAPSDHNSIPGGVALPTNQPLVLRWISTAAGVTIRAIAFYTVERP